MLTISFVCIAAHLPCAVLQSSNLYLDSFGGTVHVLESTSPKMAWRSGRDFGMVEQQLKHLTFATFSTGSMLGLKFPLSQSKVELETKECKGACEAKSTGKQTSR